MTRALFVAFFTAWLAGCGLSPLWGEAPPERAAARPPEPVALSPSPALEEKRPQRPDPLWPQHADGLSLRPTELHSDLGFGDQAFRTERQSALAGDRDAAVRIARMFQRGTNALPRDEKRMVQWLRRASDLKHGAASYELYLYYLERGLDREAVRYEKRAIEQGYVPPPRLDPRRG